MNLYNNIFKTFYFRCLPDEYKQYFRRKPLRLYYKLFIATTDT